MTFRYVCYVYILESINNPGYFYVGRTEDLRQRLKRHNAGEARRRPDWKTATGLVRNQAEVVEEMRRDMDTCGTDALQPL